MTAKKRILWVNEASYLHTGYAVYGREVMQRLHKTGKYELAELAGYGPMTPTTDEMENFMRRYGSAPQMFDVPWRYYGNFPNDSIQSDVDRYNSAPTNQFGEWRFEHTCLDFKPDIVVDIRDWWMFEFIERSPYRPYFHWTIMPTIDSEPQQEQWLSTYLNADSVMTYSEYGRDVLKRETNNKIKFVDVASPGANFQVYNPVSNKSQYKAEMGFVDNLNIVGTVMRNQARKLYPDLFDAFAAFLERHPDIGHNTYLYVHTSYPDNGWDIPMFLRRTNLSNKVLFTYKCEACKYTFPSFFQDAKAVCRRCGHAAAHLPNTRHGLSDVEMARIFNLFDVYVQYSVCEGFGMPQVEAAACGVPIMAVNYSAMESVLKNLGGIPINVQRMFYDTGTTCSRALPDNNDFVEKLYDFLLKPSSVRQKMGRDHWIKARKIYNYDRIAKIWEKHFDEIPIKPDNEGWSAPPHIQEPNFNIPPNLNNENFIKWCVINVWGEPKYLNSFTTMKMLRDLNYGEAIKGTGDVMFNEASYLSSQQRYQPFSHQDAAANFDRMAQKRNYFERLRVGEIKESKPEFIKRVKP